MLVDAAADVDTTVEVEAKVASATEDDSDMACVVGKKFKETKRNQQVHKIRA